MESLLSGSYYLSATAYWSASASAHDAFRKQRDRSMELPRHATPADVCDDLERAIEFVGTSYVMVNAVHLRWLIEDALTLRGLIEAPLPVNPHPPEPPSSTIKKLARLLAQGRSDREVAHITGYSLSSLSTLKSDPTFAELVDDYRTLRRAG